MQQLFVCLIGASCKAQLAYGDMPWNYICSELISVTLP